MTDRITISVIVSIITCGICWSKPIKSKQIFCLLRDDRGWNQIFAAVILLEIVTQHIFLSERFNKAEKQHILRIKL